MKMRVLFLCTGNSARSQMAEGLVNHDFAEEIQAYSAGTDPQGLNPTAVQAMSGLGIDISGQFSKHIDAFKGQSFDYVITLCDDANEKCPLFLGGVNRLHIGFPDPAKAPGGENERLAEFRRVRDEIRQRMNDFFSSEMESEPKSET